jgi:hypothetical protein
VAHAVAFHEEREGQRAGRHGLDIIGAVIPGRAIGAVRPCRLQRNVEIGDVLAAAEEEMFVEMGKAGLASGLVLGPDAVIGGDADDGRLAVGVDDQREAVFQLEAVS